MPGAWRASRRLVLLVARIRSAASVGGGGQEKHSERGRPAHESREEFGHIAALYILRRACRNGTVRHGALGR